MHDGRGSGRRGPALHCYDDLAGRYDAEAPIKVQGGDVGAACNVPIEGHAVSTGAKVFDGTHAVIPHDGAVGADLGPVLLILQLDAQLSFILQA